MEDFVAIDFETATPARNSACAVGLAVVRDGKLEGTFSSLIQPPTLDFDQRLIDIHGITPEAVLDAPTFAEIWPEIQRQSEGRLVVAHNAAFDVGVMAACTASEGCDPLVGQYICTVGLAQAMLPGLPNHKLRTLANVFGLSFDHHDPAADAVACAELAVRLFRLAGPESLRAYRRDFAAFGASREVVPGGMAISISLDDLDLKMRPDDGELSLVSPSSSDLRFEGERFVFTGELMFLNRAEAQEIVESQGGKATSSVSKKTSFVVVGDEVFDRYKRSGKTTGKLAKAVELQGAGMAIRIISESEFLDMIV